MPTTEKREILMKHRKEELKKLIGVYYAQRGWNETGIPTELSPIEQLNR
jgi:aldehyde:ferredoxin oxidoreductase